MSPGVRHGLTGLWAGWCLLHLAGPVGDWAAWLTAAAAVPRSTWFPPSVPGLLALAAGPAFAILAAAVILAIGRPLHHWLSHRRGSPTGWLAGLLGFQALGGGALGLALAGLYRPRVLITVAGIMLLLTIIRAARISGIDHRGRSARSVRLPSSLPILVWLAPACALPLLALPAVHHDALYYHLALPHAALASGRLVVTDRQLGFTFPVPAELVSGFALAAGLPQSILWLHLIPFACAVLGLGRAASGWWRLPGAGPAAIWAAYALAAVGATATPGKPDLATAAYPLAALALIGGRRHVIAAVVLGYSAGSKWSGMIFLIIGLGGLLIRRDRTRPPAVVLVAAALLPVVPWLVRNWIALGDPVWPFGRILFRNSLLDLGESEALKILSTHRTPVWLLPARIVLDWADRMPLVVWTIPAWLPALRQIPVRARPAALVAALSGAGLCLLAPTDGPRYALASWILIAAVVTAEVAARSMRMTARPLTRYSIALAVVAAGWLPLGGALMQGVIPAPGAAYLAGRIDDRAYRALHLPAYDWMLASVNGLAAARSILLLGEERSLGLPGARTDRIPGRGPAWVLARDARDPGRIRIRLRQWNTGLIVANVMVQYDPYRWLVPYVWTDRMLTVWRTFTAGHLEITSPPSIFYGLDGGFCVYAIRPRANPAPAAAMPYLPGADAAFAQVTRHALTGDHREWVRQARLLVGRLPNVQQSRNLLAIGLLATGDPGGAYAAYRPGVMAGWLDEENLLGFARAARATGRLAESAAAARLARSAYPDRWREADWLLDPPPD